MMRRAVVLGLATLAALACQGTARADDAPASPSAGLSSAQPIEPGAAYVVQLFRDACLPGLGDPRKTRQWADMQHLIGVTNPQALNLFVGSPQGTAWTMRNQSGQFALAARDAPPACVVYSLYAYDKQVQADFAKIVAEVSAARGAGVRADNPNALAPGSNLQLEIYRFPPQPHQPPFALDLATAGKPGGPFMAMLEVQWLVSPGPIDPGIPQPKKGAPGAPPGLSQPLQPPQQQSN